MSKQKFDIKSDYSPNLTLKEFKIEISSEITHAQYIFEHNEITLSFVVSVAQ